MRCAPLARLAQHLFTTRQLRLRDPQTQAHAWHVATSAVGGTPDHLLRVKQVHGRQVRVVTQGADLAFESTTTPDGDALVSDAPGAVLAVQVADCVPILLVDRRVGVAAAVHAGWRGTVAGIARAAVETMQQTFAARAEDIVAAVGPSIGACCYEVGDEVVDAFAAVGMSREQAARWFAGADRRRRLDLWAANRDQLVDAGVSSQRIFVAELCTQTHSHLFDSYRAHGPAAGRMAALIRVPPAR